LTSAGLPGRTGRDEFQQLDPEKDHHRIYFDIVMKEFP
jgi:hypothetical protein